MTTKLSSKYRSYNLEELAQRLDRDYYDHIQALCINAISLANRIALEQDHPSMILYSDIAAKTIHKINIQVLKRKKEILPYILDLHTKKTEGHNCNNCSGMCHVGHTEHFLSLKASHKDILQYLDELEKESLPLHRHMEYPPAYKVLRNEMKEIDDMLTETFYLEELFLVPKVFEAQKAINA